MTVGTGIPEGIYGIVRSQAVGPTPLQDLLQLTTCYGRLLPVELRAESEAHQLETGLGKSS